MLWIPTEELGECLRAGSLSRRPQFARVCSADGGSRARREALRGALERGARSRLRRSGSRAHFRDRRRAREPPGSGMTSPRDTTGPGVLTLEP